jgi:hypothetical protein
MDKADLKQDKKMIGSMINKHEKKMHQGMAPTKFAKGGKTNDMMKQFGRGMAKVVNQRGSARSK